MVPGIIFTSSSELQMPPLSSLLAGLLLTTIGGGASSVPDLSEVQPDVALPPVLFGRDVRPILSDRCFKCHGPDAAALQANLRLDSFEGATRDNEGSFAIVPGDPEGSELLRRVESDRSGFMMPPPDSGKKALTDDERATLRRWVEGGASYEEHWAFQQVQRPSVPEPEAVDEWSRGVIDDFIVEGLAAEGLQPSERAEPIALLRRLFLELTGLPPNLEDIRSFRSALEDGADPDEELDRWIDRILTEEPYISRYAERMTRPWLDQARYADTSGIHMDAGRQAFAWRDWVINAYRENMAFDTFVIEQLAGDLLPEPTIDQLIATGFNRNHVTSDEGGAIDAEYLVEYAIDRVKTTGAVFLGLTLGCSQCHDHKFDPISMKEFYGLFAFYNSNDEPGLYSQRPDSNRAFEPFITAPTESQVSRLSELETQVAEIEAEIETWSPEELEAWDTERAAFAQVVSWAETEVLSAETESAAVLTLQGDGSLLASGELPANDVYTITIRTEATDLRTILLEALPQDGLNGSGFVGRPSHGNVVIRSVVVEAISVVDPSQRKPVPLSWAQASDEQKDRDFSVLNLLEPDGLWWGLAGHLGPGERTALLLAEEPFGYEGGTDIVVRIDSNSIWSQHVLARPRLSVGSIGEEGLALLPTAMGHFYLAGPFPYKTREEAYGTQRGPEQAERIQPDVEQRTTVPDSGPDGGPDGAEQAWAWRFNPSFVDSTRLDFPNSAVAVQIVGRDVYAPTARSLDLSLGSDDGFVFSLDGERLLSNEVDRGPPAGTDNLTVAFPRGHSLLTHSIINTGGPTGAYFRAADEPEALGVDLLPLLFPSTSVSDGTLEKVQRAWHSERSPRRLELEARLAEIKGERDAVIAAQPMAMVMRERAEARPSYVLMRGAYDHPDTSAVIPRGVPAFLGSIAEDGPQNRLGLAQWLVSRENPLTARVAVNRLWAQIFGAGIVSTTDDFGYQGSWPTNPGMLDWLSAEFMESGWDVQHMLRLMLKSATWRQSSELAPVLAAGDPLDQLLGRYPRKRLSAEAIRDQALFASGLLVEKIGGPSVKPYQPDGLWSEVAMPSSNTRRFQRGYGSDLWRRSIYTYWKRAAPPPTMLTLDAPTREVCVVQRDTTDTPLQALVLMNDVQFFEAARVMAQRTLVARPISDLSHSNQSRLEYLFQCILTRSPDGEETTLFLKALSEFRWRYNTREDEARKLLALGETPSLGDFDPHLADVSPADLAAWTLLASTLLNLYETTNPR
ncbi:MAG: hypothetical protein ACI82F_003053 [Planctomycetota bacterium]|jgi:hypothetical protein